MEAPSKDAMAAWFQKMQMPSRRPLLVPARPLDGRFETSGSVVVICRPNAGTLSLRTQILWCKSYGKVWYRSGGRFLEAIEA
jgi:hypothetical protein